MAHDVAVASNECHGYCAEHADALADGLDELADDLEGVSLNEQGGGADDQAEGGCTRCTGRRWWTVP